MPLLLVAWLRLDAESGAGLEDENISMTKGPPAAPVPTPPGVAIAAEPVRGELAVIADELQQRIRRSRYPQEDPRRIEPHDIVDSNLEEKMVAASELQLERRSRLNGDRWLRRPPTAAQHILAYRIRWYGGGGGWSYWFIPGVNDQDWKDPQDIAWRYFTDHEHEILRIDSQASVGRDTLLGR